MVRTADAKYYVVLVVWAPLPFEPASRDLATTSRIATDFPAAVLSGGERGLPNFPREARGSGVLS